MKYSKEFLEANARLKTLDEETLNDELNKMSFDELLEHRDYMIQQELGEENQLSEEEAQEQIEELLQMTREPSTDEIQPIKIHTHRTGKRIAVLIAAILILVSVFTVAAVASKRDFSILNGIVRFEDGKIYVHFSEGDNSNSMTTTELVEDLKAHGFGNVSLPGYFNEGEWEVKDLAYKTDEFLSKAVLYLNNQTESYLIKISLYMKSDCFKDSTFLGAEGCETIQNGNVSVYLFDHGSDRQQIIYYINNTEYSIRSESASEQMRAIAKTVDKE